MVAVLYICHCGAARGLSTVAGNMSLSEVQQALLTGCSSTFGPMDVRLLNFVAKNPQPKKFTYRGCNEKTRTGICKVSIEGPPHSHCLHDAADAIEHFFRFEVVLSDDTLQPSFGRFALRACIWDAAAVFLNMPASTFAKLDPLSQIYVVHEATKDAPLCTVWLRVNSGQAHVQDLEVLETTTVLHHKAMWSPRTPRRGSARLKEPVTPKELNSTAPRKKVLERTSMTPSPQVFNVTQSQSTVDTREIGSSEVRHSVPDTSTHSSIGNVVKRLADAFSSSLDMYLSRGSK